MSSFKDRIVIGALLIEGIRRTLIQTRNLTFIEITNILNWLHKLDEKDKVVLKPKADNFRDMLDIDAAIYGRGVWLPIHMELMVKASNYLVPPIAPPKAPAFADRCTICGHTGYHSNTCPRG